MGGIQAEIGGRDAGLMSAESINCIQKVDAVMTFGTGEVYQDGEFYFQVRVPAAEHIQGTPVIPVFLMAIPSPLCIRVRVMSQVAEIGLCWIFGDFDFLPKGFACTGTAVPSPETVRFFCGMSPL